MSSPYHQSCSMIPKKKGMIETAKETVASVSENSGVDIKAELRHITSLIQDSGNQTKEGSARF